MPDWNFISREKKRIVKNPGSVNLAGKFFELHSFRVIM